MSARNQIWIYVDNFPNIDIDDDEVRWVLESDNYIPSVHWLMSLVQARMSFLVLIITLASSLHFNQTALFYGFRGSIEIEAMTLCCSSNRFSKFFGGKGILHQKNYFASNPYNRSIYLWQCLGTLPNFHIYQYMPSSRAHQD